MRDKRGESLRISHAAGVANRWILAPLTEFSLPSSALQVLSEDPSQPSPKEIVNGSAYDIMSLYSNRLYCL